MLQLGSFVPEFSLLNQENQKFVFSSVYGELSIIWYMLDVNAQKCQTFLLEIEENYQLLLSLNFNLMVIFPNEVQQLQQIKQTLALSFNLLSDNEFVVGKALGVVSAVNIEGKIGNKVARAILVLDSMMRIRKSYYTQNTNHIEKLINNIYAMFPYLKETALQQPMIATAAPILIIPSVVDPILCSQLIALFEHKQDGVLSLNEEKKFKQLLSIIDERLKDCVIPVLSLMLQFKATRREEPAIVKTTQVDSKAFRANGLETTAYRRFAMIINLNADGYLGGGLTFPECDNKVYKPLTGDAIIYSAGLLAATTKLKAGIKWWLVTYFYGEEDAKLRSVLAEKASFIAKLKSDFDPIF